MFTAPEPRFQLYTKLTYYINLVFDGLFGRLHKGPSLEALESKIADMSGSLHAICTPTARTGIYLVLTELIRPGQKVICSPITIVEVINMIICAGGIPVFADVEDNTCNIDANQLENLIDDQTGAVFITHLHGLAADVEKIKIICDRHNIPLIEDAAQALSTRVNGKWMGTHGTAGVFSFGLYKNITGFYGGMILTQDKKLRDAISKKIQSFPPMNTGTLFKKAAFGLATDISTSKIPFSIFSYWFFRYGFLNDVSFINDLVTVDRYPKRFNTIPIPYLCRMKPVQARIILKQLNNVDKNNDKRIEAAKKYHDGLSRVPGVICPPLRTDGSHIYTYYPIRVPDRKALNKFALKKNRDFVLSHYHNCASLEIFKDFKRDCPHADATAKELLYLPTYPGYSDNQIQKNIETIRAFFKKDIS